MAMNTKENILDFFLSGHLKLSHYDYRFMAGLKTIITNKGKVTSNQTLLFDNLLTKYKKQLTKNFPDSDALVKLPWTVPVVPTTSEHTSAYVTYESGNLRVKVPFSKKFINFMNNPRMWGGKIDSVGLVSNITWENNTKTYVAVYNTMTLKFLAKVLPEYFSGVVYCNTLSNAMARLTQYENCVWAPTLKEVNNRLYVIATNPMLAEAMGNINLIKDVETLYQMAKYGVSISPELYKGNRQLELAALDACTIVESELELVLDTLKALGHDKVVISTRLRTNNITLTNLLDSKGILFKTVPSYLNELVDAEYRIYITDNSRHKLKGAVKNIILTSPI